MPPVAAKLIRSYERRIAHLEEGLRVLAETGGWKTVVMEDGGSSLVEGAREFAQSLLDAVPAPEIQDLLRSGLLVRASTDNYRSRDSQVWIGHVSDLDGCGTVWLLEVLTTWTGRNGEEQTGWDVEGEYPTLEVAVDAALKLGLN